MIQRDPQPARYVVCVANPEWPASLELRKIYCLIADEEAEGHGMVRVVDESGEDYLYPADCFVAITPPARVIETFACLR